MTEIMTTDGRILCSVSLLQALKKVFSALKYVVKSFKKELLKATQSA